MTNVILRPLRHFAIQKPDTSFLLLTTTIVVMILANPPWADRYRQLLAFPIGLQVGQFNFLAHHGEIMSMPVFVNGAFMAVFFFVIGLGIKQEVLIGELSSVWKTLLPIIAACGGAIMPVLLYMLVYNTPPEVNGVTTPMATDIASALAVLGLLRKRVPLGMRIFLTTLAVVDDVGGITIITLFCSEHIAFEPLLISLIVLASLYVGEKFRVHNRLSFYIGGLIVWLLSLELGTHPTIAGVSIAFVVPARSVVKLDDFTCDMTGYLSTLDYTEVRQSCKAEVLTPTQIQVLNNIHTLADKMTGPLQTIVDKLHPSVSYVILPLFTLVNAGVTFEDIQPQTLANVPLVVFVGLFVRETLDIFSPSYLFACAPFAPMSTGMSRRNLFGVPMLGGTGFTVALFIANLSFSGNTAAGADFLDQAKLGAFTGSSISGLCGYLVSKWALPKEKVGTI